MFTGRDIAVLSRSTWDAAMDEAAELCEQQADACQPGSPAEAQNWPLCLMQMARRIRDLKYAKVINAAVSEEGKP